MNTAIDFSKHPCFSPGARHRYGRVHLPVAPRCNMQCHFCNRKYDCMNESRPGVTSTVLTPQQALAYYTDLAVKRPEIAVVGIAGPGDPFANADETMETLRLIRARFPEVILCIATNGLGIGPHIDELAALKVSHVTISIMAVDPFISGKIYAWVREDKRPLRGQAAGELLIERQLAAVRKLKERGITVKINSIIIPGINDLHIHKIAEKVAELGADIMNCIPMVPVKGAEFENLPAPDSLMTARVRLNSGQYLPQMTHCARCRADAVGLLSEQVKPEQIDALQHFASLDTTASSETAKPRVAVASQEGVLVNQHLGEARQFLIYEPDSNAGGSFSLKEIRPSPESGGGAARWEALAGLLRDCRALLVSAAGPSPVSILSRHGLRVVEMEGLIDEGLRAIYADQPIPAALRRRFTSCGSGASCKGTGIGCG